MRVLTSQALLEKDKFAIKGSAILKIDFGGSTGVKYFSSSDKILPVTSSGLITDWGSIFDMLDEEKASSGAKGEVKIADPEGEIFACFSSEGIIGSDATVFQAFDSLGESDMVPLCKGLVLESPVWDEKKKEVSVVISDISFVLKNRLYGIVCDREYFDKIGEEEEGSILPLVYGEVKRSEAVLVTRGAKTKLAADINATDDTLYVDDASKFPSGPIRLRIGSEEIAGSFSGNTFTITSRGCGYESGTTSEASGSLFIIRDATLTATEDNEYAGLYVRLTYGGYEQVRAIVHSIAATGALVLSSPFYNEKGSYCIIEDGISFEITTVATKHAAGEEVVEVLDEYVYVAAGHETDSIQGVEVVGIAGSEIKVDGRVYAKEREGFKTLPVQYYSSNVADAETFPLSGQTLTTIKMKRLPTVIASGSYLEDKIHVNLKGRKDSGGLINNPARVIEDFLKDFGGIDVSNIDSSSISAAESATSGKEFSFSTRKRARALDIAADLAFQSKLALLWTDSKLKLKILQNNMGPGSSSLDADKFAEGGVSLTSIDHNKVVSEIHASYLASGIRSNFTIKDEDVEDEFRGNVKEIFFWAYSKRHYVREVAEFWLRRLRHRYYEVTLTAFLTAIEIEKGDTIELDRAEIFPSGQKGRVLSVKHTEADYRKGNVPEIEIKMQLPAWEGCSLSCEHVCETTACESSGCEMSCTSGFETSCNWTCETNCEEICELSCMTTCELSCQGTCMISRRAPGGDYACESTCETGCESSCEGWACETSDETDCAMQCETEAIEEVIPVRQVKVLSSLSAQYGTATVIETDTNGNSTGSSFTAYDPFDVHPVLNAKATVYLNFDYQWVFVPSDRLVKYVSVLDSTAEANKYSVQEQSKDGVSWGSNFYAWAVDSV